MKKYDLIVVGAGASGLIAAGRAAERGAKVLLLEKMSRPGLKLLITAQGRCNVTNTAPQSEFIKRVKPNGKFLKPAVSTFFSSHLIALLKRYGVATKVEDNGRVFPESEKSKDVLQALLDYGKQFGVDYLFNAKVEQLILVENRLEGVVYSSDGRSVNASAQQVLLATGGKSYPATGSEGDGYALAQQAGHSLVKPRPALVPLVTKEAFSKQFQGAVLHDVLVKLMVDGKKMVQHRGDLLFTHFGVSGPVVLAVSGFAIEFLQKGAAVVLQIDTKPDVDIANFDAELVAELNKNGKKNISNILPQWLPSKVADNLLEILKIDPKTQGHQVKAEQRKMILKFVKEMQLSVIGNRSFKDAIVTAGGVPTAEIFPKTMMSKSCQGLFFAGELIDLDGETGGYNLQLAFSSGYLTAQKIEIG